MLKFKKIFFISYLSGLILLPILAIILPADFFDKGHSLCLSVLLFNQTCYGCGMGRAVQHLSHFDFAGAMEFNRLSIIVLPLLAFLWFKELIRIRGKIKLLSKLSV